MMGLGSFILTLLTLLISAAPAAAQASLPGAATLRGSASPSTTGATPGPLSFHFHSTATYASLNQVPTPATEAEWQFEIDHLDMAHSGADHFAGIKPRNSNFFFILYRLMFTAIQGTEEQAIVDYCAANACNAEDAYLHYNNDTTVSENGQTRAIPGCKGTVTSACRIQSYGGSWRWPYNWKSPTLRGYMTYRSLKDITVPRGGAVYNGMFIDEAEPPDLSGEILLALPKTTRGGQVVEFANETRDAIIAHGELLAAQQGMLSTVSAALRAANTAQFPGRSLIYPNTANYTSPATVQLGLSADGALTEFMSYETETSSPSGAAYVWNNMKTFRDAKKIYILAQGNPAAPSNLNYNAGNYRTAAARHQMYALASYWMGRDINLGLSYYEQSPAIWAPMSSYWYAAQEHDIGQPSAEYYLWQSDMSGGGDSCGQYYKVWRRDYSSGAIVLFRTRVSWNDSHDFKDYSCTTPSFALGANYMVLYPNNRLAASTISSVQIRLAEGLVLIPQ